MPRPVSLMVRILIAVVLVLVASSASLAQPAPNPCPDGEVVDVATGQCVPADALPGDDGEDPGEPDPVIPDTEALTDFTLLHYACDAGFDARAGTGDRGVSCVGAGKPAFTYTVSVNGRVIASTPVQTSDGARGRLDINSTADKPIPAGEMVISVTPIEGWASDWVFCEINSSFDERVIEPPIANNAIAFTTNPTETVTCDWFNVAVGPAEDQGNPPVVDVEESTGPGADITIATFNCPPGTTIASDLNAACTERAAGLTFSLLTEAATVATQSSSAEGDIFFEDVAPGDYGIAVELPSGYGEPVVLCYHTGPAGVINEGPEDIVFGNQFRFTVAGDGEFLECAWYNLPAAGADNGPNIFIEARACDPGAAITSSTTVFEALDLCPSAYVGLEFSVLNVDQVLATGQTNADALSPGQVFFTRLPEPQSGAYAVVAHVADGEGTLAVYCDQDFGTGTFEVVPVRITGDRMDQELGMAAGDTLRCSWFVQSSTATGGDAVETIDEGLEEDSAGSDEDDGAEEDSAEPEGDEAAQGLAAEEDEDPDGAGAESTVMPSLTLQFRTCPEGVDPAADPADLDQTCAVDTTERSLMLTLDGVTSGETISGTTTWPMQDLTIYVDTGASTSGAVNCIWTWADGADQEPPTVTLENGMLTVTLAHAETAVSCNWFIFTQ